MAETLQDQISDNELMAKPSNFKKMKLILIILTLLVVAGVTGFVLIGKTAEKASRTGEITGPKGSVPTTANTINPKVALPIKNREPEPRKVPSANVVAIANRLLEKNTKLNDSITSGKFLKAKNRCKEILMRRKHGSSKNLDEEVIEEIYNRAFKVYIEKYKSYPSVIVETLTDEAIRRDENLKNLVLSGKVKEISEKFEESFNELSEIIKNEFDSKKAEILEELRKRAELNSIGQVDDCADLDFEALASKAESKDCELARLIRRGEFYNVKMHFITKTLKLFNINSKMSESMNQVIKLLIKRAEENFCPSFERPEMEGGDFALDFDSELKRLVDAGQSHLVKDHFTTITLNMEGIDSMVTDSKDLVLNYLTQTADYNRIQLRKEAEEADEINSDENENIIKPANRNRKRVSFNPELAEIHIISENDEKPCSLFSLISKSIDKSIASKDDIDNS